LTPFAEAQGIPHPGRAAEAEGGAGGTGLGAEVRAGQNEITAIRLDRLFADDKVLMRAAGRCRMRAGVAR